MLQTASPVPALIGQEHFLPMRTLTLSHSLISNPLTDCKGNWNVAFFIGSPHFIHSAIGTLLEVDQISVSILATVLKSVSNAVLVVSVRTAVERHQPYGLKLQTLLSADRILNSLVEASRHSLVLFLLPYKSPFTH